MRTAIMIILMVCTCLVKGYGQEKIFTVGYGVTYIENDSVTVNFNIDLNRIPGQSEKEGGIYFINELLGKKWFYYLKPTMDINIGSGVTSVPNNISVGLDGGVGLDFKLSNGNLMSIYFNASPELIADKTFKNNLYVFSISPLLKYGFTRKDGTILNSFFGMEVANGIRNMVEVNSGYYGRLALPIYLEIKSKEITKIIYDKNEVNKVKRTIKLRRFHWVNSFKFNWVHTDENSSVMENQHPFFSSKLDFYITKNLGLNITYTNGRTEPLYTDNNSLSFGISLAK